MIYDDAVYGRVEVDEPALLELIDSSVMSRLRGVHQGGITGLLGIAPGFSRFDHSLGVCLLLRRLGAPLMEQVAGLLHDSSHTAFSHVVDFLYPHADQAYHEELLEDVLAGSDVPAILARHGMDWRWVLDERHFPLLEQPLPALCADRVDYFLRDAVPLGLATPDNVAWVLEHLAVRGGRICVVGVLEAASWLGRTFLAADEACWSNLREIGLYQLTAEAIRDALATGCLAEADLHGTDWPLWHKLQRCDHPDVVARLALVKTDTRFVLDPSAPDFVLEPKIRAIDPDVWLGDRLQPLSALDPAFGAERSAYLARKSRPWPVRIVPA